MAIPGTQSAAYGFGVPFAGYPDAPVNFEIDGHPGVSRPATGFHH